MSHILIVEDDKPINELIARNLKLVGHTCEKICDGLQAVALANAKTFDLVLLDIMLPGLDGFEVIQRISPTPVILLTAKDGIGDRIHGLNMGADDYIVKPFDTLELLARVAAVLRRTMKGTLTFTADDTTVDLTGRKVMVGGTVIEMTPREFELLEVRLSKHIAIFNGFIGGWSIWNLVSACSFSSSRGRQSNFQ
ncbi:MAG: response regulator transcription factor [Desulfitobacteriaceae bacterium]